MNSTGHCHPIVQPDSQGLNRATQGDVLGSAGRVVKADHLIYLATPYSHPDSAVRESRFVRACEHAGHAMQNGFNIFCPISHTHPIAVQCDLPKGFEFWEQYDRAMLSRCTSLWVVCMDGWRESKGVQQEIIIAAGLRLPTQYLKDRIPHSAMPVTALGKALRETLPPLETTPA